MFPWVSAGLFFLVFYCLSRTYFIVTFEAEINDHRKPYPAKWQFIYSACEAEALQGLTCFIFVSHLFIQPQENINS